MAEESVFVPEPWPPLVPVTRVREVVQTMQTWASRVADPLCEPVGCAMSAVSYGGLLNDYVGRLARDGDPRQFPPELREASIAALVQLRDGERTPLHFRAELLTSLINQLQETIDLLEALEDTRVQAAYGGEDETPDPTTLKDH